MTLAKLNIMITSSGGSAIRGIYDCLRAEDTPFHITGVDANPHAIGRHFADSFFTVPYAHSPDYIHEMIALSRKNKIDLIIPGSDEEVLALSKNRNSFTDINTRVLASSYDSCKIASDKGLLLNHLKKNTIEVPEYRLPESVEELKQAVLDLGYPEKKIIIKPRTSRGARGFWILDSKQKAENYLFQDRSRQTITFELFYLNALEIKPFPSVIVMEYLAGADYNIDVLADQGQTLYSIPIERIKPAAGPVQTGKTVHDSKIETCVKPIIQSLEFNYNINIEMAYRDNDRNGNPMIYEINPRISAPIAMHKHAGINLLYLGILLAMGETVDTKMEYHETIMERYFTEQYTMEKGETI